MSVVFVLLAIFGAVALARWRRRDPLLLAPPQQSEAMMRSGGAPSHCSWCKTTTLAGKLFLFEHPLPGSPDPWRSVDAMTILRTCPFADVPFWAAALSHDQPRWRRLCSEKCTREWLSSMNLPAQREPAFTSCAYCSARLPMELRTCNNCGAPAK